MIPGILCKFCLRSLVDFVFQGGVSRERVLYVLPVPRVKKSVYNKGKSGYNRSAVKNDTKCVQGIDDEMQHTHVEDAQR